jgi:hypothetical protein
MAIAKFGVLLGVTVHCNKVRGQPQAARHNRGHVNYREASQNTWQGSTKPSTAGVKQASHALKKGSTKLVLAPAGVNNPDQARQGSTLHKDT